MLPPRFVALSALAGILRVAAHGTSGLPEYRFRKGGHCTASAVDPKATLDGSSLIATSADGSPLDHRLIYVPAKDHPEGSMRPIYDQGSQAYPRYVDADLAPGYAPLPGQKPTVPIGHIPQVAHTYAYWDAAYGVMNEHQLTMGESSCAGKLTALALGQPNGTAMFGIGALSDVAMERCRTARCAIETMGSLASRYGFYGTPDTLPDGLPDVMEAGETLTVGDTEEAWVFHVTSDDTGRSAVWVAQRVPDGHAAAAPNVFVVRDVDCADAKNFICSPNMFDVAKRLGWWDGHSAFDFTAIYSPGEYMHPYYAQRRIWRILSLLAPSLKLDPQAERQPFSVKPDKRVSPGDIFAIYRDHLEGTEFDLTQGRAAGPYGTPSRFDPGPNEHAIQYGAWERSISLYRTSYSYVAQARKEGKAGGVLHFAPGQPHASVFVPLLTGLLQDSPASLSKTEQSKVYQSSLWWAVTSLANLMDARYSLMISDVRAAQSKQELSFQQFISMADEAQLEQEGVLQKRNFDLVDEALTQTWGLFWEVMAKYQNGYGNYGSKSVGYPSKWLEDVGYGSFHATHEQFDRQKQTFAKALKDASDIFKRTHRDATSPQNSELIV